MGPLRSVAIATTPTAALSSTPLRSTPSSAPDEGWAAAPGGKPPIPAPPSTAPPIRVINSRRLMGALPGIEVGRLARRVEPRDDSIIRFWVAHWFTPCISATRARPRQLREFAEMTTRPRRSVLYMPGSNARALEKAKTLPCDAVILDLEDSVAPEAKVAARQQVVDVVKAGGFGAREVIVRINALDTQWWLDDLAAAAKAHPDGILVPKISKPGQLQDIAARLIDIAADQKIKVWAMMETPIGIINAPAIAASAADPETRLAGFVMGTNDIAKET